MLTRNVLELFGSFPDVLWTGWKLILGVVEVAGEKGTEVSREWDISCLVIHYGSIRKLTK